MRTDRHQAGQQPTGGHVRTQTRNGHVRAQAGRRCTSNQLCQTTLDALDRVPGSGQRDAPPTCTEICTGSCPAMPVPKGEHQGNGDRPRPNFQARVRLADLSNSTVENPADPERTAARPRQSEPQAEEAPVPSRDHSSAETPAYTSTNPARWRAGNFLLPAFRMDDCHPSQQPPPGHGR